jgi:8-oxo-dGTP pyrophosphatase MutT (NUDIX family)
MKPNRRDEGRFQTASSVTAWPPDERSHLHTLDASTARRLRRPEQVAAICYRIGDRGLEFLLVRTGSRRWIFPKGCVEPGLSHAQAAALEAYEEAGVHGRIEEAPFARYVHRKGRQFAELATNAHLCEVTRMGRPKERGRNPTWFSSGKAKRRLRRDRPRDDAAELARVVDRAVARIRRLHETHAPISAPRDPLRAVPFEADEIPGIARRLGPSMFAAGRGALPEFRRSAALQLPAHDSAAPRMGELLQLEPSPQRTLSASARKAKAR